MCVSTQPSFDRLSRETEIVGYPVLPLIKQLNEMAPKDAAKYIHWGATTQDIMDTAAVLQIKSGLDLVERELVKLTATLTGLAQRYRDTPMAGRTHMQHALPITLGYKFAITLSAILSHRRRLAQLRPRVLTAQLGGAAGTLASLRTSGLLVLEKFSTELALAPPPLITWHVSRDAIAETISLLALIGGTLAKSATDTIIMSSTEFAELSEPFVPHRGASSTMPQKRNPISSELVAAAAKMLRANTGLALDALVADFERASGPWHLEWAVVPESFVLCVGALGQMNFVLEGLVVHEARLRANLGRTRGLIVAEAVMMRLGEEMGRQKAHDVVYEACSLCVEEGEAGAERTLVDVLLRDGRVREFLGEEEVRSLCRPENYMGVAGEMVDAVVKEAGGFSGG